MNTVENKKIYLLDAYALIFRGYYAFIKNPMINSANVDTSAIFGFTNSLLELIKKETPEYIAVAFDKGGSHYRKEIFEEYKANRQETPEAIKIAVPYIYKILQAMNIPVLEVEGYEADDIIGTISKKAEKKGYKVYMVTPDKDFGQLVSDNIFMYKPSRNNTGIEILGVDEIKQKFEIENPEQVIDFLAMMGDAVDNIPGLPGVGEKTAKKFIKEFGSIENLLNNTNVLKGKLKEKIESNKEQGMLSKKLATIMLDVPIDFKEEEYKLTTPNFDEIQTIFEKLEFKRLLNNINNIYNKEKNTPISQEKETEQLSLFTNTNNGNEVTEETIITQNIKNTPHFYQLVDTGVSCELLVKNILKQKSVCFDTETTNIKSLNAELVGIAFSWEKNKGYYVPFPENENLVKKKLKMFLPFFENKDIEKIGHNIKYDIQVLGNYNVQVNGKLFDTMIAHYLINADSRHGMDVLAKNYLKYQPISIETLIGKKGKKQRSMRTVALEEIKEYAVEDADVTFQLKRLFSTLLEKNNATKLFFEVEMPLLRVLSNMETEGVSIDVSFLKQLSIDLKKQSKTIEADIYNLAGTIFNIASPKQLGEVLFDKLKLVDKPKKTKTGQYATGEDILAYLSKEHIITQKILDYRKLQKLLSTYIDALPLDINNKTNSIHTIYNQAVASTGRLSSNNPNLQNIPIKTELGREIRKAFIPKTNENILISADYSQIELRVIAALSEENTMIKAFYEGLDIHKDTASKVFNVAFDKVTKEQRSQAKTVNFGIIYGVSAFGLTNQTSLTRTEAKDLIDNYFQTYPKLKNYMDSQIAFCRKNGYVETILGRRRYLKDINSQNHIIKSASERNAINAPIQGSAADIIKIAMCNLFNRIETEKLKSKLILQVHDELVLETPKDEAETVKSILKHEMETAYNLSVPLLVEIGMGKNWLEAH